MYETIVILNPNTTKEVVENKITDWTALVKQFGADIQRTERMGKKNLAYDVKKFHQGIYILFHIAGKHDAIAELERRFRIADEVIRYQTVKLTDLEYKTSSELLDGLKMHFSEDTRKNETDQKSESIETPDGDDMDTNCTDRSRDDDDDESDTSEEPFDDTDRDTIE